MRTFGRFLFKGERVYGEVLGDEVHFLARPFWLGLTFSGEVRSLGELTTDVPVAPGKVIAVGLNYSEHIEEMPTGRDRLAAHLVQGAELASFRTKARSKSLFPSTKPISKPNSRS